MNGEAKLLQHSPVQQKMTPGAWERRLVIFFLFFSEVVRGDIVPFAIPTIKLLNYFFIGFLALKHYKKVTYLLSRDVLLLIVMAIALLSFFWSADPNRSARLLIALVRVTFFGLYLAACYPIKDQFRMFSWVAGLSIVVNFAFCLLVPAYGLTPNPNGTGMVWSGLYLFKQFLGRMIAFASSICLVNAINSVGRIWWIIMFLMGLWMLWQSKSMIYLSSVVATIALVPLYNIVRQQYRSRMVLFCLAILAAAITGFLLYVNIQFILVDVLGKNAELNGRTPIWNLVLEQLAKNPWLGYGYAAFWGSDYGLAIAAKTWAAGIKMDFSSWHAHNAFLDLALQVGLIGVGILSLHILVVVYRVVRSLIMTKSLASFWMLNFLLIQLIASVGEVPTHLSYFSVYWTVYVAIGCSTMLELERAKRRSSPSPSPNLSIASS